MRLRFNTKQDARDHVWRRLETEKLAAFPFPPRGRIPNFKGSGEAAKRLFGLAVFADARAIKVNPDSAQRAVRREALKRGITVYVPTPRLAAGFMKLDPARLEPDQLSAAADMSKCREYAEEISLQDLPQLDAIVCGSVAVTRSGFRAGKGAGYSDMEFAILAELGHRPVPVATTVHDVQLIEDLPQAANDQGLSYIVTPTQTIRVDRSPATPAHIDWDRVSPADLEAMPVLAELKRWLDGQ